MEYEYCPICNRPLINEANLRVLRIRWAGIGIGVTVGGGVLGACLLPILGFGSAGIAAGSWAASVQGPAIAAGSAFAICQSLGATGLGILLFGAVGTATGGAGALRLIYAHRALFNWCSCNWC